MNIKKAVLKPISQSKRPKTKATSSNNQLDLNQIYSGDCLQLMKKVPNDFIDLSITSPPYNKQEKNNGHLVKKVVYATYKDALPEKEYQENQIKVLNETYRITKPGGSFFYNHKIRYINGGMIHPLDWLRKTNWTLRQEIIWDRTIAGNIRGWRFWPIEERIYWLYKPIGSQTIGQELDSKDAKLTSIWRFIPENNNPHPAPFPLWLPARIILSLLKDKGIVFDPYIGSGTTAVATKLLKHNYLGIDIDENYCNLAQKRIDNCLKEESLILKEKQLHVVKKSLQQRRKSKNDSPTLF